MTRKLTIPIRFSPETVKRMKDAVKLHKKYFPNKRVTYDDLINFMFEKLDWL